MACLPPAADAPRSARPARARGERPSKHRSAEQRDEVASVQLIELHFNPASQGRIAGYRIGEGQSGGIGPEFLSRLQSHLIDLTCLSFVIRSGCSEKRT